MSGNLGLPHTCPCRNVTTANTAGQLSALFGLGLYPQEQPTRVGVENAVLPRQKNEKAAWIGGFFASADII